MKKLSPVIIMILSAALIISVNFPSKKADGSNSITSEEIREIVREELKNELSDLEVKVDRDSADVDYERIEEIVEDKLADFNKDFGENFEDATMYFGGKIKDTWIDIEDYIKK